MADGAEVERLLENLERLRTHVESVRALSATARDDVATVLHTLVGGDRHDDGYGLVKRGFDELGLPLPEVPSWGCDIRDEVDGEPVSLALRGSPTAGESTAPLPDHLRETGLRFAIPAFEPKANWSYLDVTKNVGSAVRCASSGVPVTSLGAHDLGGGHDDAVIVRFPDGTEVQGTAAGRPEGDPEPLFGLYLDRCWAEFGPAWDHVIVDWPDHGLPADLDGTANEVRSAFARARSGERVEVGCIGGSGRTGTVVACMAILAGVPPTSAVAWTRDAYKRSAIETKEQEQFVESYRGRQ